MITKKYNWKDIFSVLNSDSKIKLTQFLTPAEVTMFWQELPIIFASVKARKDSTGKYSASETLNNLPDNLNTPKGAFSKQNLSWLIASVSHFSRTRMLHVSQSKNAHISSLVPMFLAAQKNYNNIKYNEWSREDEKLKLLMGEALYNIVDYEDLTLTEEQVREGRILASTTYKGEKKALTAPITRKIILAEIPFKAYAAVPTILLQMWVAHSSLRHENMILDLKDWDSMPEAIDANVSKNSFSGLINVNGTMPW